jgi:hypothetical protein
VPQLAREEVNLNKVNPWRPVIFFIGLVAGGIGCYGAYEYALKLENGAMSYLVVAAPLVAVMATLIPPLAEYVWKQGEYLKSALWWSTLVPVACLIFLSAAERVHMAKANQSAEVSAKYNAAIRAKTDLDEAKAELKIAESDETKAKVTKNCNLSCQSKIERANMARERVKNAEIALSKAESVAILSSEWRPPVWLLPAALDLVAFMAVWTGLSGPWVVRKRFWYHRRKYKKLLEDSKKTVSPSGRSILRLKRPILKSIK